MRKSNRSGMVFSMSFNFSIRVVALLAAALFMTSCATEKRCLRKHPPQIIQKDSVVIKDTIIYKDRIIYDTIPADTVKVIVTKIDSIPIILENDYSIAKVVRESDTSFRIELIQKDSVIARLIKDAEVREIKIREEYSTKTTIHKVKYIPGFYKFCLWYFIITIILILLYIVLKVILKVSLKI